MKAVKVVLVLGVILVLLGYFGGSFALQAATRRALPRLEQMFGSQGIEVTGLDFGDARIASLTGVRWSDIVAFARPLRGASSPGGQRFDMRIKEVGVELQGLFSGHYRMTVTGLVASPEGELASEYDGASTRFREAAALGRVEVALASIDLEMSLFDPLPGLEAAAAEVGKIVREGRTALPVELYAEIRSLLDGQELGVRLRAVDREGETLLHVDQDDLRRQAKFFSRPLTDLEIELVAEHPLRAPDLLMIKRYAEQTATRAREKDGLVPEDAYRHVLWSYLLTREFGAEFAEKVTDAHEIGSTTNTEAEHRMDYNNNAVGRSYAEKGVAEAEILARVRRDPAVIQQAS